MIPNPKPKEEPKKPDESQAVAGRFDKAFKSVDALAKSYEKMRAERPEFAAPPLDLSGIGNQALGRMKDIIADLFHAPQYRS